MSKRIAPWLAGAVVTVLLLVPVGGDQRLVEFAGRPPVMRAEWYSVLRYLVGLPLGPVAVGFALLCGLGVGLAFRGALGRHSER